MQLVADRLVLTAELDQLLQLGFELRVLLAQRDDLPLRDGNRAASMRVRHEDLRKEVGVLLEKRRMRLEVIGDRARFHRFIPIHCRHCSGTFHSPSNTVSAGPVIMTGVPSPSHTIVSAPPRIATRTGESINPRRMPATAAA